MTARAFYGVLNPRFAREQVAVLLALDLGANIGPALVEAAFAQGLLINAPRPDSLRFMPALNVGLAEIDRMLDVLDGLCRTARAA